MSMTGMRGLAKSLLEQMGKCGYTLVFCVVCLALKAVVLNQSFGTTHVTCIFYSLQSLASERNELKQKILFER